MQIKFLNDTVLDHGFKYGKASDPAAWPSGGKSGGTDFTGSPATYLRPQKTAHRLLPKRLAKRG